MLAGGCDVATAPEPKVDPFAGTPHQDSREGWWTQYGGLLDPASGVIAFPPGALPPCRVPECSRCRNAGKRDEEPC